MAIWRPVSGSITRLDPTLASVEQIEDFFAERRIIARAPRPARTATGSSWP